MEENKPVVTNENFDWNAFENDLDVYSQPKEEIAAAYEDGRAVVPEVCICFQNKLFRANRTTKHSAELLNAFRSDNYPILAEVGVSIHYNRSFIRRIDPESGPLRIVERLDTRLAVIRLFPGMGADTFRCMLSIPGLRGVILETYGSGNAPTAEWFIDAVADAVARGLVVLNVTQCPGGSVSEIYETGKRLGQTGVVSGRDITTESAVTKMMVALGASEDPAEVRRQLAEDRCGEMTV